jgi:hypothetical protein
MKKIIIDIFPVIFYVHKTNTFLVRKNVNTQDYQ